MKKWLIALLVIAVVIIFIVVGFLIVKFVVLAESTSATAETEAVYEEVEAYAAKSWPGYEQSYDEAAQILTLSHPTTMSYENACSYGGNVYTDELAPETYLEQVRTIAVDVIAHCGCPSLNVVLQYTGTEGEPIFTVSSDGTVWTCWE